MIIKAFELFKAQGYTGTIDDYREAIEMDETLLEDSKNLVSSSLGKTNGVAEMDATVTPEPEASESMELESEDISSGLEDPEEYSYFGDLGKKIKAGTYRALATISEIPNYLNSFKGAIGREFMTEEERKRYDALDPVVQDAINNIDGISFLPGISGSSMPALAMEGRKKYDEYKQKSDALYETLKTYETTIGEDILDGNFAQATARTFSDAVGSLPSLVQAMIPGVGIASIALGSAAEASREARETEGKKNDLKTMGFSTIIGASEGLLEVVTKRIGGRMFKGLAGKNKNVIKKTLKDFVFNVSKEYGKEGASETATEIINTAAEAIYLNKEVDFDEKFAELVDVFIIGGAVGGGMGTTGGGAEIIRDITQGKRVKKELAKTDYNDLTQAYSDEKTTTGTIELSQNPNTEKFLNYELNQKVKDGDITQEQSDKIKLNFRETQGVVNSLKPLGLDESFSPEIVNLVKKQKELQQNIKEVDNPALTQFELESLKNINKELNSLVVQAKESKITKGARVVAEAVGFKVDEFDTAEDLETEIQKINKEIQDGSKINVKKAGELGFILQFPDGEQRVLLNKEQALKENIVSTASHEVLHGVLFNTVKNKGVGKSLGESLISELNKIDKNQIKDSNFKKRLQQYVDDVEINEDTTYEEALTLFSEALINGDLVYEETLFTKIGDFLRRTLAPVVGIKFNKGKDVYNFIRDYNRTIETGKGLKTITKAAKGVGGKLTEVKDLKIKENKSSKNIIKEAYEELQQIDETEANFTQQPEVRESNKKRKEELLNIVKNENAYEELRLIDEFEADFNPNEASTNRKKELLDLINKEEKQEIIKF